MVALRFHRDPVISSGVSFSEQVVCYFLMTVILILKGFAFEVPHHCILMMLASGSVQHLGMVVKE
jgi:hypothetical protein